MPWPVQRIVILCVSHHAEIDIFKVLFKLCLEMFDVFCLFYRTISLHTFLYDAVNIWVKMTTIHMFFLLFAVYRRINIHCRHYMDSITLWKVGL